MNLGSYENEEVIRKFIKVMVYNEMYNFPDK